MTARLGRTVTQVTCEDPDGQGGLAIWLSQERSSALWRFQVRAHCDEGVFEIGTFTTTPPNADGSSPKSRIVAVAACPGAQSWTVSVEPAGDAADADGAEVSLAVGMMPPGLGAGVQRVAERYAYHTGTVGTLSVPEGEDVIGWTAFATGAGATVVVAGGSAIPVPTPGSVSGAPGRRLRGPVDLVFAATSGYLVEVALSA